MLKKLAIAGAVLMAAAALCVALFAPEQDVQANSPMAPISVDVELVEAVAAPLEIDSETGLPKGAVMFQAGDHVCVALANGTMECFCPCETGSCLEVEASPVVSSSVGISTTVPYTTPTDIPEIPDDGGDEDDTPSDSPEDTPEDEPDDPAEEPGEDEEPEGPGDEGDEPPADDDDGDPPADDDDDDNPNKGNNGHGNNEDGYDSSNPGKKKGEDESAPVDDEKPKKGH